MRSISNQAEPLIAHTLLVVIETARSVFMGIDSKRIDIRTGEASVVEKMVQTPNFLFVATGLVNDGQGFNVHELARQVASVPLGLKRQVEEFERLVQQFATAAIKEFKDTSPEEFNELQHRSNGLDVFFAGIERKGVQLYQLRYTFSSDNLRLEHKFKRPTHPSPLVYDLYGTADELREELKRGGFPRSKDEIDLTLNILRRGAELRPDKVGPPFWVGIVSNEGIKLLGSS